MSSHLSKTDSHLYNVPRPKRKKEISTSSSSSLNFTSTLSSLISSAPFTTESRGRPRPSHNKADVFTSHNKGAKKRAARDLEDQEDGAGRKKGDQLGVVDDAVLARSQRKLQEKAKEYNELKRSSHIPEGHKSHDLVEWDRKWAENKDKRGDESSGSDIDEIDPESKEIVEFEDELGRTRYGTRAQKERMERKIRNELLVTEELERMSARPQRPSELIIGPKIQIQATSQTEEAEQEMKNLAKKRDRSATPPPASHYDASKEIRSKGVGFYAFSKDEELREQEMRDLQSNRAETERLKKEIEEKKNKRKREVDERKELIARKKAKRMADKFLDEMGSEIPAPQAKDEEAA